MTPSRSAAAWTTTPRPSPPPAPPPKHCSTPPSSPDQQTKASQTHAVTISNSNRLCPAPPGSRHTLAIPFRAQRTRAAFGRPPIFRRTNVFGCTALRSGLSNTSRGSRSYRTRPPPGAGLFRWRTGVRHDRSPLRLGDPILPAVLYSSVRRSHEVLGGRGSRPEVAVWFLSPLLVDIVETHIEVRCPPL